MSEDLDKLLHGYLEGALSEGEARLLNERLKSDAGARGRLAEMAFDTVQLPDVLGAAGEGAAGGRAARALRTWLAGPGSSLAAAAVIVAAVGAALLFWPGPAEKPEPAPVSGAVPAKPREGPEEVDRRTESKPGPAESKERPRRGEEGRREKAPEDARKVSPDPSLRGFRGRLKGEVVGKGDNRILLRVTGAAGEGDELARKMVGGTFDVRPGLTEKEEGELVPDQDHESFIRKVRKGQAVELDLRYDGAGGLSIAALTEEQIEWARSREKRHDAERDRRPGREGRGGDREEGGREK